MAVGLSQAFADALLNVISGTTIATNAHQVVAAQPHSADPGASGTTASLAGNFDGRLADIAWSGTITGTTTRSKGITNTPEITCTSGTPAVSHLSLWSANTAGTFRASVALGTTRNLVVNDILRLTSLTFTMTPVAT